MRRTPLILILALAALPLAASEMVRMETATANVTVQGTSTLHAWEVTGTAIRGWVEVPAALLDPTLEANWIGSLRPASRITIPAKSLRSDHSKMTELMLDALAAKKHPEIAFTLSEILSQKRLDGRSELRTRGSLTIAGVTRPIEMDVQVIPGSNGRVAIEGKAPIRMRDYGIKPPTAMLGTIRTGNEVSVSFTWVVTAGTDTASR